MCVSFSQLSPVTCASEFVLTYGYIRPLGCLQTSPALFPVPELSKDGLAFSRNVPPQRLTYVRETESNHLGQCFSNYGVCLDLLEKLVKANSDSAGLGGA